MRADDRALLEQLSPEERAANGVPSPERAKARAEALALVAKELGHALPRGRVRLSPLGAGWSMDLDVDLVTAPDPKKIEELGWVPLGGLSGGDPYERWAVLAGGKVLAGLDLHVAAGGGSEGVDAVLERCVRTGRVTIREVLELLLLRREGHVLPSAHPVVRAAARAEAALGGADLAAWLVGHPERPPIELGSEGDRVRARLGRFAARPVVVAVSGVDGAGKSTLADALAGELAAAGFNTTRVWARPGMEMRLVKAAARAVKRLLRKGSTSAVRAIARGESEGPAPASRSGVIGWTWALLVTLSYLARVRGAVLRSRGIVVFDRHLLDALVTLDFVYGNVDLRLQRALVKALVPKAAITLYLAIPAEEAIGRKHSAVFGEHAVRTQLELYAGRRSDVGEIVELDATMPRDRLVVEAVRAIGWTSAGRDMRRRTARMKGTSTQDNRVAVRR